MINFFLKYLERDLERINIFHNPLYVSIKLEMKAPAIVVGAF